MEAEYMFVMDDSGHWYIIDSKDEDEFYHWIESVYSYKEVERDFNDCRLGVSISRIRFKEWRKNV